MTLEEFTDHRLAIIRELTKRKLTSREMLAVIGAVAASIFSAMGAYGERSPVRSQFIAMLRLSTNDEFMQMLGRVCNGRGRTQPACRSGSAM